MSAFAHETRTVTLTCPRHGEYAGETVKFNLFGLEGNAINPKCPICQQEIDAENSRKEEAYRKCQSIKKWRSMNIEPRFYESSFDNFNAYNSELRAHLDTCRRFVKNHDGKLVMLGENGNGKTHLAISVLKEIGGVIYRSYEIGLKLRQSYSGEIKEWEVFDELCSVPLLVIDEVEKIKDSEAKQQWVSYVIGKRYDRMLPIIFIGNCHSKKDCREPQKPCYHCIEYHLEDDVLSRIIEDGIIMVFNSGDYREKIRDARLGRGR
jgi:DNA replication protein DnaC